MDLSPHERLGVERRRLGWKLQEAAEAVGCTPDTLSRVEAGRRPSGRVAAAIERVFGVPAGDWYAEEGA